MVYTPSDKFLALWCRWRVWEKPILRKGGLLCWSSDAKPGRESPWRLNFTVRSRRCSCSAQVASMIWTGAIFLMNRERRMKFHTLCPSDIVVRMMKEGDLNSLYTLWQISGSLVQVADLRGANFEERRTAVLVISCRTRKGVAMKAQVPWNALVVLDQGGLFVLICLSCKLVRTRREVF